MKKMVLALCLLCISGTIAAQPVALRPVGRDVMVMAHRGCWRGGAPEVSVAAIRACEAIGPDIVEVDVQRTRDGHLVLMHDDRVDRMTNGRGAIANMTMAQVRALRLRAGDGGAAAPLTNEHVPTLEEGLSAAKGKFVVNLHLKLPVEREVAEVVKRLGMVGQVTTWVSGKPGDARLANSAMHGMIGRIPVIGECDGSATTSCWAGPPMSLAGYAPYQPTGFYIIPHGDLSSAGAQDFIRSAASIERPSGTWIMASTLFQADNLPPDERREIWRTLVGLGVQLIMTDHPAELIEDLQARGHD